jgi:hypothetical protein
LSLVEIQMALLILFMAVLAVVGLAPLGLRQIDMARQETIAVGGARHLTEQVIGLKFEHQLAQDGATGTLHSIDTTIDPDFTYVLRVWNLPTNWGLHRVQVDVSWHANSALNRPFVRTLRLVTDCAKP